MTPEAKMKQRIRARMEKEFPGSFRCTPIGTGYGGNGDPDFIFCVRGLFVGVEAKGSVRAKVTALQGRRLNMIAQAGGIALVVRHDESLDDAVATIRKVLVGRGLADE